MPLSNLDIIHLEPMSLVKYLSDNFTVDLSSLENGIKEPNDYYIAQKLMYRINSYYSYMLTLQSYAKLELRKAQRINSAEKNAENKRIHEDMTDRCFCIDNFVTLLKKQSETVSRMITAKQEANKEINMNTGS